MTALTLQTGKKSIKMYSNFNGGKTTITKTITKKEQTLIFLEQWQNYDAVSFPAVHLGTRFTPCVDYVHGALERVDVPAVAAELIVETHEGLRRLA